MSFTGSIEEVVGANQTVYDVYFSQADSSGSGAVGAIQAMSFLRQSKLKESVLKEIWDLSDPTGKGYLDRQNFYISLKLVALAQSSQPVSIENLTLPSPPPKLGDISSNITSLIAPDDPWYIKASSRIAFDKIFDSLSPINNKITGARVKPYLLNSALSVDILGKIWELSDLDQDGQLDRDEFLIALQLVTKAKEGLTIPDSLPPSLLPFKIRHSSINGSSHMNAPSALALPTIANEIKPWVVSIEEKSKSDITFEQIDTDKDGFVNGLECKDVFLQTGLSQNILAQIWALCDINTSGKLNCEQFALAMHLINKKLTTGLDPPMEMLPEMVPPSLRVKPILIEETHISKEFEELQTQVTELQREKLFYEQRANEHDMATRQKRTELTNLELVMDSLFKTLKEREINKSEESKKLTEYEDKQVKLSGQLSEAKSKYESENDAIEKLKMHIHHMDTALKTKDDDLSKVKTELQMLNTEYINLEAKLSSRQGFLSQLNSEMLQVDAEIERNKSKIEIIKKIQENLNVLLKEYDKLSLSPAALKNPTELPEEIKNMEDENQRLYEELRVMNESGPPPLQLNQSLAETQPFESSTLPIDDPFQKFDPFNTNDNSDDPFKAAASPTLPDAKVNDTFDTVNDPFASAFDPFGTASKTPLNMPAAGSPFDNNNDDWFTSSEKKKGPPPRPAPPRPQTPNFSATKKPAEAVVAGRPQSSLDFTKAQKIDLFKDFNDPFANMSSNNSTIKEKDPFDPFGAFSSSTTPSVKNTNDFDPFA